MAYGEWAKSRTPQALHQVVQHLGPTIDKAINAYAPNASPVIRDRARLMAADAVRGFDAKRGASLHTHVYRQLQTLQRVGPQVSDPLPMPDQLRRDRAKILKSIDQVTNDLGREPSDEEVSEISEMPLKHVQRVRSRMRTGIPMSTLDDDEDDGESAASDPVASRTTPQQEWHEAIYHDLGDIDRVIMQYRTGYRGAPVLPNQDIARRLKISPAAVTQRASRIQARLDEFDV